MLASNKCVKCGCGDIVAQATVAAHSPSLADMEVQIRVDAAPDAILFHKTVRSPLIASVCAGCGYVEFYASDAQSLHNAFVAAQESSRSHAADR